jgi:hypothetical protein
MSLALSTFTAPWPMFPASMTPTPFSCKMDAILDLQPQPVGESKRSFVCTALSSMLYTVKNSQWPKWSSTTVPRVGTAIFITIILLKWFGLNGTVYTTKPFLKSFSKHLQTTKVYKHALRISNRWL